MDAAQTSFPDRARRRLAPYRRLAAALALCLLGALIGLAAPRAVPLLGWTENWVSDIRFSFLGPRQPERQDIMLVTIDETTLEALPYRSPVDRGFLAVVLERLAEFKIRAVALDILFERPTEPEKDQALVQLMRRYPVPLVVAWADPGGPAALTEQQHAYLTAFSNGLGRGYANLLRDGIDGTVRWINIWPEGTRERLPGLAAAVAERLGVPLPAATADLEYAIGPNLETPAIPAVPAHVVALAPAAFMAPLFAGRTVLIGGDLPGQDRFRTPFAAALGTERGVIPGVAIHAHALAQLLDRRHPATAGLTGEAVLVLVVAAIGVAMAWADVGAGIRVAAAALAVVALWAALFAGYTWTGIALPLMSPTLAFVAAGTMTSFYQQRRYNRERGFIRGALSRYVAEHVVHQLEREPWRLKLGGERRNLSFLFTDIAGFTTLSERVEPGLLVAVLNRYLDGASRVVLEHDGIIDKYIGDAVVACFGAFSDDPDHPAKAVRCALALDRFAEAFAAEQRAQGVPLGLTRIGVNTGSAIIGNFGGELRFDYTAIGDAVNTAARLEGANKHLGTRICVAGTAAERAGDVPLRPVAELAVKGKDIAVPVFEPLAADAPALAWLDAYREAYDLLDRDTAAAAAAFARLAARYPDDPLVRLHHQRLLAGPSGTRIVLTEK